MSDLNQYVGIGVSGTAATTLLGLVVRQLIASYKKAVAENVELKEKAVETTISHFTTELKGAINALTQQINALQKMIERGEGRFDHLEEEVQSLRLEVEALKIRIAALVREGV